jgi:beta-ureidopropionase / N-carbamoyl-L-amino-acid hydrolase
MTDTRIPISAQALADRLSELDRIGVGPGGVNRLAWTAEDAASVAWFENQARELGLAYARDPAGNLWACPDAPDPWWGTGSHLDSVRDGGRFDGPLGVVCGLEVAARGVPLAVISFADEEGARFNTPTFGSKALTGRLDLDAVLRRRDDQGIELAEAMLRAGVDPREIARAPERLARLTGFVEIHIDQTTALARAGAPIGIVSSLASRVRVEAELLGRADHAGTTPPGERRDALATAARLILAAENTVDSASALTVTCSRIIAEPNASTTIASRVRLWIDARSRVAEELDVWMTRLREVGERLASRSGVAINLQIASRSDGREFSQPLRASLAAAARELLGQRVPEVVCYAGHDAGVLAERIPAAMLLVRNEQGISHSPQETVDLEDAAIAARVLERALADVSESWPVSASPS